MWTLRPQCWRSPNLIPPTTCQSQVKLSSKNHVFCLRAKNSWWGLKRSAPVYLRHNLKYPFVLIMRYPRRQSSGRTWQQRDILFLILIQLSAIYKPPQSALHWPSAFDIIVWWKLKGNGRRKDRTPKESEAGIPETERQLIDWQLFSNGHHFPDPELGLFLLCLGRAPWPGYCSSQPAITLDFLTTKSRSWKSIFKVMNK